MANNKGLAKAKDNKKDEFYTVYETIQEELNHYESYFENEEVKYKNAILTAEAAIAIAINDYKKSLRDSNCLIIGFGRIGKILADILKEVTDIEIVNINGGSKINVIPSKAKCTFKTKKETKN